MPDDPSASPVSVRTLVGQRVLPLFLHCWPTAVACSVEPFETVVHDDGTLGAADIARITAAVPRCRVLPRHEADGVMAERLRRHEHARAFRAQSVWGLKLLDVALGEGGDCYYMDCDLRFFRPFSGLFRRNALAGRAVFLRDTVWLAYSVRPWHLLGRPPLQLVEGINTGLTLIDPAVYDLDFVDWFLGHPEWRALPGWTEPTCWAALAARLPSHVIDPRQVTNLYPSARVTDATIGAHFLSSYRQLFQSALATTPRLSATPEPIRFQKLRRTGPLRLGWNQLRRKLANTWQQHRAHP